MWHKLLLLSAIMIHGNVTHGNLNIEMSSAYSKITSLSALKPCELTSGCSPLPLIEFFHKLDGIGNDASISIWGFTTWKQKKSNEKFYPQWGLNLGLWLNSDSKSSTPFWANWAYTCKTETLGSLYSHALLIPTKWSKSKNQVMHKQKFTDPLSSTCPVSS